MVQEISLAFFSDLREISLCEIVPTQKSPPPCTLDGPCRSNRYDGVGTARSPAARTSGAAERPPGSSELRLAPSRGPHPALPSAKHTTHSARLDTQPSPPPGLAFSRVQDHPGHCLLVTAPSAHHTVPPCAVLHCTSVHYTTLHYTTLHCTALHYTTLLCVRTLRESPPAHCKRDNGGYI